MKFISLTLYAGFGLFAAFLAGCNSSTDPSGGGSGFSAKIDGEAWEADPIGASAQALAVSPGCYLLTGSQAKGDISRSLTLTLYNIAGPGTYALGTDLSVYGGSGTVGQSTGEGGGKANAWTTAGSGLDGEIVITEIGQGRIKATFRYDAVPGKSNPLTNTRAVTEGRIDMAYTGTAMAVSEKHGGRLTATLNGKPYNAATIYGYLTDINGNAGVRIVTTSTVHGISLYIAGATAPGTYKVIHQQPNPVSIIAGRNSAAAEMCCWGAEGDAAEIEITSLTSSRVKGKFRGRLVPNAGKPATIPLDVVDGAFDVGIP